ncbi:hypothetical protein HanRHA438_Chr10g0432181 [Helianthus annuus]|nr:hypothetical protein HanHA89_Chr10g0366521 [Helianthus annuus]KAJ0695389.1 hypothetical protein HanLR1_Chr10g0345021 [Helianthus annuus]KAJ0877769.1 hypothetical protein HanRHA438_Chr10g0432181 [Helianthus annuus]
MGINLLSSSTLGSGSTGFEGVVENAINSFVRTEVRPDVNLTLKLKHVRSITKSWYDRKKAKDKEDSSRDLEELTKLDLLSESGELNVEECWIKAECLKNIKERDYIASLDIKQKSRCRWAVDGDENSSYFHELFNNRKKKNCIPGIYVGENWITKPKMVKKEILGFFRNQFSKKVHNRPVIFCHGIKNLSEVEAETISGMFTDKEVKDVVFECGSDKAPGPDGFNFKFLKHFWRFFEADFRDILNHFHESGSIDKSSSSSFITLVLSPTAGGSTEWKKSK